MSKFYKALCVGLMSASLMTVPAMADQIQLAQMSGGKPNGGGDNRGGGGGGGGPKGGGGVSAPRSAPSRAVVPRVSGGGNHDVGPKVIQRVRPNVARPDGDRPRVGRPNVDRPRVGHHDGDGHRYRRGTRHLWGGLPFYFYDGYYYGDCSWLRRRAEATGSRYWWVRYRQCREAD